MSSFPGSVDDARIYNYALTPAEVAGVAGFVPTAPLSNTWLDSGNAISVLTFDGPYAGARAMSIHYHNEADAYIGEVSAAPAITDMTQGAGALSLWVLGDPANGADSLYVALEGAAGASAVVANPDAFVAQNGNWANWIIPLERFAGVDLASVAKLAVGVGNGQPGGTGTISIDEIRLSGPQLPEGLVGYWTLDGDFTDSSGNGNDGQAIGDTAVVTDRQGDYVGLVGLFR